MGHIIDDLLFLSRVTRRELKPVKVDLSAMAEQVCETFQKSEPARAVSLKILLGIIATCDEGLMRIVLENLLGNAWKYTAPREAAQIELGSTQNMQGTIFFVRDNGVGFDMKYVDKLFLPFQRLHGRDEFEGTGIGLAIVRRIVDRHSGQIWIESELEKGTTVFFTLGPASEGDDTVR